MYAVTVTFTAAPEHADAFRQAVLTQAETSVRKEETCRRFDVCADPAKPGVIFLYELYDDAAAFQDHLASDHFKAFDAKVTPWLTSKTVQTWEVIGSPR